MARQAVQAARDAQEILEQAQLRADAATLAAARARAAAAAEPVLVDVEISDEEAEAAAAPGHEPGHDDPFYDPTWPHGWYGGCCNAPTFQNKPEHCELRGGGEEGPWIEATQSSGPILRRPFRSWRERGGAGHGYRLFLGGLLPAENPQNQVQWEDVRRWLYAAGGCELERPMIEYPGV